MKELVYTSAPAGLRPGTSGFCTVAMTDGLPAAVVEFLERLSNTYRPVYMPYDPRAADNPVAYSLIRARPGTQSVLVLSRNAAAGTDHTGRSNNLAHHLVFESPGPGDGSNPAATAALPGTFLSRWDESPRRLPARSLHGSPGPRGLCRTWEEVTGDAGWAATVAAAWAGREGRPLYLIYPPETELLPLLAEAIGLVPADRRWDCTFTTYYTGLSPEATCVVRAVLAGSPQEAEARRGDHIDLMDLDGPPPDSVLAAKARGRAVAEDVITAPVAVPPMPARRAATTNAEPLAISPAEQVSPDEPPPMRAVRGRPTREQEPILVSRNREMRWAWLVTLVFGPLALLSLLVGGLFGKIQMDARHDAEQELAKIRAEKTDVDDKSGKATQRPDDDALMKTKAELNKAIKERDIAEQRGDDLKQRGDNLKRRRDDLEKEVAKEKALREKAEQELKRTMNGKKSVTADTNRTEEFDDWFAKMRSLSFGKKVVNYKKLEHAANKLIKKEITIAEGSFELEHASLPKSENAKEDQAQKSVLRMRTPLFAGEPKQQAEIVAIFKSGPPKSNGQDQLPTYLPVDSHALDELKVPLQIQFVKDNSTTDPVGQNFYFIEDNLPDKIVKDPGMWVFIVKVNTKIPEARLLWLKKGP